MQRLRPKLLTCFYCGRRSDTRFDGVTRQFDCKHCEATNYLDSKGEITDPPVATDKVAAAAPTASIGNQPRAESQPSTSESVFCDTCLKNQRLYVASLAQYLETEDDDDVAMDKDYYRFRQGLEKRYPRSCSACDVKVQALIEKANYTAKTDHLRKMMQNSWKSRHSFRRGRTLMDVLHQLAQWLWWMALVLQCLWHGKLAVGLLSKDDSGMSDPDEAGFLVSTIAWAQFAASYLPSDNVLLRASVTASVASAWWNPKFLQVKRGFSRHLSGFGLWYFYQVLICVARGAMCNLDLNQPKNAQMSAHLAMASIGILIHSMAIKCFKTDTTPLFGSRQRLSSPEQRPPSTQKYPSATHSQTQSAPTERIRAPRTTNTSAEIRQRRKDETRTLAEALDDALPDPNDPFAPKKTSRISGDTTFSYQFEPPVVQRTRNAPDPDAMDWTPTASPPLPRALRSTPSKQPRLFGDTPTTDDAGPFYYRNTPQAPMDPARKLRNPPNQPAIWSSAEKEKDTAPSSMFGAASQKAGTSPNAQQKRNHVEFGQGRFFAPRKEAAEDESLANIMGKGFSLNDKPPSPAKERKGFWGWGI